MKTIHAIITGRVQGVFFRDNTQRVARELGVTGWVRNNSDGTVELQASGNDKILSEFSDWIKHGPSRAKVTDIQINIIESKTFSDFLIIH